MKKLLLAASLATVLSASVQADTLLGLYLGGQVWANQSDGVFGDANKQIDFNLDNEQQGSFYIAIEHPLPLIPNVKISSTTLDTQGKSALTSEFVFNKVTYKVGDDVNAVFDVSYVDYTFYYEVFDNDLLTFDFGLTARDISADVKVNSTATALTSDISAAGITPMLYVAVNVGLPFTGFNVFAEGNFLSVGDNSFHDYQAGVSYELVDNLAIDINLTLGYRTINMELDDLDNLSSNIDFNGVFAGAIVHF
ncbi:MAG: outer membrane protein [Alteromonadaceae bacterium]|jgi:outer membrane protein